MLELNNELSSRTTLFIEVILPLAIAKTYTYRVPADLNAEIEIGKRVVVQFGKSRIYTAIIYKISTLPPELYEAKYIIEVLDEQPIVNQFQLNLWEWIAEYYLCNIGEVMQAALPAALKLASETKIILLRETIYEKDTLSDKEFLIIDALDIHSELKVSDISKLLGQKTIFPLLKSLFDKNIIHISEEVVERYKPKKKAFISLNPIYKDTNAIKELFQILERSPKQLDALMSFTQLARQNKEISKSQLLEASNCGVSSIKSLITKEIFIQNDQIVSRLNEAHEELLLNFTLSDAQNEAYKNIKKSFNNDAVTLLHGITSSGKTQVYIRLIEDTIAQGKQVLYLLPEIGLTTQIIERLRKFFGNNIGVYHSKFSDNERAEIWNKLAKNEYQIILGARSAVFLPFSNLGLIIVDEEHESSYKQFDPAPRYNARDTAIYLASVHGAKVLLGSATPSIETYYNAKIKKFGLVELFERYGGANLPEIHVVNIAEETQKKTLQFHLSSVLVEEIKQAVARKEQIILFQNRRGYTPVLLCRTCGFTPKCINCDVSLTFHKSSGKLHCHYCGYKQDIINTCPACGSAHIEEKGFGTEKIEDELGMIFPGIRISRMDLDATRAKNSFQKIISDFEEQKIDVMVGTQMVTKGLDFEHVTLIGIISADSLFNYPDFRAYERSYQLLAQVSGRAGRREKSGKVIIQAYDVNHRVLNQVIRNDFNDMFNTELIERKNFLYPPFYRLIIVNIKHKDFQALHYISEKIGTELKSLFGSRILGPEQPLIGRIRNYYLKAITIKVERSGVSIAKMKQVLKESLFSIENDKSNKGVIIQIDVDPY